MVINAFCDFRSSLFVATVQLPSRELCSPLIKMFHQMKNGRSIDNQLDAVSLLFRGRAF
jgi:hypothetical protein